VKKRLTKTDLTAEVLKRIRAREGCEGVSKVVLEQTLDKHPDCNWAISVIDAVDAADPIAVGPVSDEAYEEMASEFKTEFTSRRLFLRPLLIRVERTLGEKRNFKSSVPEVRGDFLKLRRGHPAHRGRLAGPALRLSCSRPKFAPYRGIACTAPDRFAALAWLVSVPLAVQYRCNPHRVSPVAARGDFSL
jgi:hypothetical protein